MFKWIILAALVLLAAGCTAPLLLVLKGVQCHTAVVNLEIRPRAEHPDRLRPLYGVRHLSPRQTEKAKSQRGVNVL